MQQPSAEFSCEGCCHVYVTSRRDTITYTRSLLFLTIAACSRSTSAPVGIPPDPVTETRPVSSPVVHSGKTWTFSADSSSRRYTSTAQTTIELADSINARDQVIRKTVFSLAFSSNSSGTQAIASIDELSTNAGARIGSSLSPASLPFKVDAQIVNGGLVLQRTAGSSGSVIPDCNNPAMAALPSLQRAIVATPYLLVGDMTWRDSSLTSSCSGTVPVSLTTVRQYRVLGESSHAGIPTILLERLETATFRGEGSQNQHRILISGTGTGTSQVHLHPVSGRLMSLDGEHRSDLVVTSSGRQQRFKQVTREAIVEGR